MGFFDKLGLKKQHKVPPPPHFPDADLNKENRFASFNQGKNMELDEDIDERLPSFIDQSSISAPHDEPSVDTLMKQNYMPFPEIKKEEPARKNEIPADFPPMAQFPKPLPTSNADIDNIKNAVGDANVGMNEHPMPAFEREQFTKEPSFEDLRAEEELAVHEENAIEKEEPKEEVEVQEEKAEETLEEHVKEEGVEEVRETPSILMPVFVREEIYKMVLKELAAMWSVTADADKVVETMKLSHENTKKMYGEWQMTFEDMQRKMIYIDKVLFEQR